MSTTISAPDDPITDKPTGPPPKFQPNQRIIPTNMFELQAGKAVTQKYLDSGEITRDDIALLQKSYTMIGTSSFLASSAMGVATWFLTKKYRPTWNIGRRLAAGGAAGMFGSFLGFAVGGVGAAMEVSHKMEDSEKKMRVFGKIAYESRQAIIQARNNPGSVQLNTGTPNDDPFSTKEQISELDRERNASSSLGQIEADSKIGSTAARTTVGDVRGEIQGAAKGAWDKIRTGGAAGNGSAGGKSFEEAEGRLVNGVNGVLGIESQGSKNKGGVDTRTKEQRDFDEMLDRERRGVDSGTDEGRWR